MGFVIDVLLRDAVFVLPGETLDLAEARFRSIRHDLFVLVRGPVEPVAAVRGPLSGLW